ncbi:MAG TPA: glycosyltransferase family 4 protein [Bryobacteraceae bacterium]|nr:glycosyltransferase family 4 protein [Bryobacteraceae bacterium]
MTPIRVVAFVEAASVTGPAGNLIRFCKMTRRRDEISVSVAAFHRGAGSQPPSNPFFDALARAGIEVDLIRERRRFDSGVVRQMREIAERRSADIVQTHAVKSHFLARYGGLHRRHRWIAFHHGYTAEDFKMRLYMGLDNWSLRGARRVVTVCGPFAKMLAAKRGVPPDRIEVVPNSIEPLPPPDPSAIQALSRNLALPENARVLLSIGRFSSEKGHIDLLRAFELLNKPDLRLVLVGSGIDRPRLEKAVASCRIGGQVIFAGQQRDVWPYYGLADVFVLPSLSEGSPNVLLEAMAARTPIVATAVGGVPETVQHESTALLTPPQSPQELAAAISRVLNSSDLAERLTTNAYARVTENFSPQSYYDRLRRIYSRVIAEPL